MVGPAGVSQIVLPPAWPGRAVNVYLQAPSLLVDTGPDTPESLAALEAGLASAEASMADLRVIFITHLHDAHAGLAGRLAAHCQAVVVAHPASLAALANPSLASAARAAHLMQAAAAAGAPPLVLERALVAARAMASWLPVAEGRLVGVPAGRPLPRGGAWRTVDLSGHSPDQLGLVETRAGVLLSGDAILRADATVPVLAPGHRLRGPDGGIAALVATWRRLAGLPVDAILPGHGPAIRAPRVLVARRVAALRDRLRLVRGALAQGASTVWEVAEALSGNAQPEPVPKSAGEAAALLEWLMEQGGATSSAGTPVRYALRDTGTGLRRPAIRTARPGRRSTKGSPP
jgi:glyoxylase-like metal-dependent hydrolase (beta-lactamase superfamily II)